MNILITDDTGFTEIHSYNNAFRTVNKSTSVDDLSNKNKKI